MFGARFKKSLDNSRTSENAWCMGACAELEVVRKIQWRIGNLTGISEAQAEFLQMLRYQVLLPSVVCGGHEPHLWTIFTSLLDLLALQEGQYYRMHHDFIPGQ